MWRYNMDNKYFESISEAAEYIKAKIGLKPEIAIVLGSGLGPLANEIEAGGSINYSDIPGFPATTVEGHEGRLVWGKIEGKPVIAMKGRFHYYEGYDISQVVLPIRAFKLAGINNLIVTNAAGGINKNFKPGDLMLITDHISFFAPSPLRGRNIAELGDRFPDMTDAYCSKLRKIAVEAAYREGIELKQGVYAFAQGPMYETPAEIKALAVLGADAAGMSTVPEVIAARHAGMKVLGISCITNMAAGILDKPLEHGEVIVNAKRAESNFVKLVKAIVRKWKDEA